eukprot:gene22579-29712_t
MSPKLLMEAPSPDDFAGYSIRELKMFLSQEGVVRGDGWMEAPSPDDFAGYSIRELKMFLSQAGIVDYMSGSEKSDLANLAKTKVSAWEVRRLVACRRLIADPAQMALAVFRGTTDRADGLKAAKKKMMIKVHPDKNMESDVDRSLATDATHVLTQAFTTLMTPPVKAKPGPPRQTYPFPGKPMKRAAGF